MARNRKTTIWGQPGQTGVTPDGIPWRVPDTGPSFGAKLFYTLFPGGGTYMPAGAKFVPASTGPEVHERIMRKHGDSIRRLLRDDEELQGFADFFISEKVPQPPRNRPDDKSRPNPLKRWWMGGDWSSMAGQLNIYFGGSRIRGEQGTSILARDGLLIRTSQRIMIWKGTIEKPMHLLTEYGLDQIGVRPDWNRYWTEYESTSRVDVGFPDGSWLGVNSGCSSATPGGATSEAARDLFASLAGKPVSAEALPALGRK